MDNENKNIDPEYVNGLLSYISQLKDFIVELSFKKNNLENDNAKYQSLIKELYKKNSELEAQLNKDNKEE